MPANPATRFPKDLIDVLAANEAIAVVGSGASVAAGFPDWHSLLALLIKECEQHVVHFKDSDELKLMLRNGHYIDVADACTNSLRGSRYRDFIQRIFRPAHAKPTKLHSHILSLPVAGILTTNFDTLLEQEYIRMNKALRAAPVYNQNNVTQLAQLASERQFFIFKAHGNIDDIDSIILSQRDYRQLLHQNAAYRTALSALFATRSLIFIGYGLRDPDFNFLLSQQVSIFRGFGRRHFAFIPDSGRVKTESLSDQYNITVIPYSSANNHAELTRLIANLAKHTKESWLAKTHVTPVTASTIRTQRQKIREVMEYESRICLYLDGLIELDRAKYLKSHAKKSGFSQAELTLLDKSIKHWEDKKRVIETLEHQLMQSQKMETLGTLAGGIAHDFNNLLVGILGYQNLAEDNLSENNLTTARECIVAARQASLRASDLVRQILTFSRYTDSEKTIVDFTKLIEEAFNFLRSTIPTSINLELKIAPDCRRVMADATQIHQVLLNLGSNAAQAMDGDGGTISITLLPVEISQAEATLITHIQAGRYLKLIFSDTGHGMDEKTKSRIFDPFFTTKEMGQGTGLGLSVVYGIIQAHGGAISVESAPGNGATFIIYLPEADLQSVSGEMQYTPAAYGNGELIAVVDDEEIVRNFLQVILKKLGYRTTIFDSALQCLEELRRKSDGFAVLLTDQTMPSMRGTDLAKEVHKMAPKLPIIIMSGYPTSVDPTELAQLEQAVLLVKPFTKEELANVINCSISPGGKKGLGEKKSG